MKTIELMSTEPRSVRSIERLDAAARAMWEGDCGLVPVVDADGKVVGVLTDRDVCMASYTQGRALGEIPVAAVMAREVAVCRTDDPVANVMHRMQQLQVHRLPVVDARGVLVGVLSTNDLVRASHARPAAVDPSAVVRLLATIGAPRRVVAGPALAIPATAASPGATAPAPVAPPKKAAARRRQAGPARPAAKPPAKGRARKQS